MDWIDKILKQITDAFKWWVIILPWEQGVKVWLGKHSKVISPGIHFRMPYFHSIYAQSIRITFTYLSPQTLTTKSNETLTLSLIVGYVVTDIEKVYNSVNQLEGAITGFVSGEVSKFISSHDLENCQPHQIEENIKSKFQKTEWGVDVKDIYVTSYAVVKTYRLIQDTHWMNQGTTLDNKR